MALPSGGGGGGDGDGIRSAQPQPLYTQSCDTIGQCIDVTLKGVYQSQTRDEVDTIRLRESSGSSHQRTYLTHV